MSFLRLSIIILLCAAFSNIDAIPARVLLIRHAEKPPTGNQLSIKGKERAAALAPFFAESREWQKYGKIAAIYAARPGKEEGSVRSQETVEPLSKLLNIPIQADYS